MEREQPIIRQQEFQVETPGLKTAMQTTSQDAKKNAKVKIIDYLSLSKVSCH